MLNPAYKIITMGSILFFAVPALAESIVEVKPFVSTSIEYDDNVFRLSSSDQAKAVLGSSDMSDVTKQLSFGVDVNLRLSRQLITLSSSLNDNRYDRFDFLDNTAQSHRLTWNWRLGNDFYGELRTSTGDAISGFDEVQRPIRNLRTSNSQLASINWNFHPDWTVSATREYYETVNDDISYNNLDRDDDIYEGGVRYQNQLGTLVGLAYHLVESKFPNRIISIFGNESTKKDIVMNVAWLATPKTRISTRLSQVSLEYKDVPQRDFNAFNQRWSLDSALTGKTNITLTAYKEAEPLDDVLSLYVNTQGFSVNPVWHATSKVDVSTSFAYEERSFLGDLGVNRSDESKLVNLALNYTPTAQSLVQVSYQGQDKTSNIKLNNYQFNSINLLLRYDF